MLNTIAPGTVSSAANPVLDFWAQRPVTDGTGFTYFGLGSAFALSFQIWDVRDEDAPTQLFPSTPGQKHTVDLVNDKVADADGHYAAAWTCTVDATTKGRYQIQWFFTAVSGGPEVVVVRNFDVLPAAATTTGAGTAYALVSDMRDEGIGASVSDARILRVLGMQARYIEKITRRVFRPIYKTSVFDGSGGRETLFDEPLIALVGVSLGTPPLTDVDRQNFRVFNRHIANGMIQPDDRSDPKIEFAHFSDLLLGRRGQALVSSPLFGVPWRDHYFPEAVQNVTVRGLWGYTDYDGSPTGMTPELIAHVQKLLALREIPTMAGCDSDERDDRRFRPRITGETTRDQSYTKQAEADTAFTGDRAIDDILELFMSPCQIGSA